MARLAAPWRRRQLRGQPPVAAAAAPFKGSSADFHHAHTHSTTAAHPARAPAFWRALSGVSSTAGGPRAPRPLCVRGATFDSTNFAPSPQIARAARSHAAAARTAW